MFAIDYSCLADDIEKQVRTYGYTLGKTRKWVQNIVLGVNIAYVHGCITKSERQKILKRIHNRIVKDLLKPIKEKNMTLTETLDALDNNHTIISNYEYTDKEMCEALTIAVKSIETLSNIINIMENTSPYEVESEIENALENFKEYVEAE